MKCDTSHVKLQDVLRLVEAVRILLETFITAFQNCTVPEKLKRIQDAENPYSAPTAGLV